MTILGPLVIFFAMFALLVVGLLIWSLRNPTVRSFLVGAVIALWRLIAVVTLAAGIGLLIWGITAASLGEQLPVGSPAGMIGSGAASLAGGILLLVLSFIGRSSGHRSGRAGRD
ncbi:MAG: hypothetical protein A2V98_15480 [Planctomycetes bacterium RBG_16_64_12]|nr:MAG: hypothetical protein A2V98_15480 [Planctomycetes bacterium RBG_16_64_12]